MRTVTDRLAECALSNKLNIYRIAAAEADQTITEKELIPANPCQDCYSVAKVFTATAIGMLVDRGRISLEDSIVGILKEDIAFPVDDAWRALTVRHALIHRCGLPQSYLDIDCDDIADYGTDDFLYYIFNRRPDCAPGTRYRYTDAAYYLLSRAASRAAGVEMEDFLWQELLMPLGVREAAFSKCPKGHAMGGTGLYIRTCDVAKLGSVYACDGLWHGRRIFSEAWVKEATEHECAFTRTRGGCWAKGGMYGQMLMFSKEKHTAYAWHGFKADAEPLMDLIDSL